MELLTNILFEIWSVTTAMAPYLLLGFLMAGVLSVVLSREYIQRHLGSGRWVQSFKAALFGVPLPICSCGVLPLAATLRKQGASRGATASFLASTPQTGVDSLMITYALMGWVFALFRAAVAFLSGILCGITVNAVSPNEPPPQSPPTATTQRPGLSSQIKKSLTYGFIDLPRDIARAMLLGIVISGLISALLPEDFFSSLPGGTYSTMLLMLLIGIPLYVCSSGSVPIALAFMKAGISPGAALIFLITGPATNAATLTTLWKMIGRRQLIVFLLTLILCALLAGIVMNQLDLQLGFSEAICHTEEHAGWMQQLCAVALILLLINGMRPKSCS